MLPKSNITNFTLVNNPALNNDLAQQKQNTKTKLIQQTLHKSLFQQREKSYSHGDQPAISFKPTIDVTNNRKRNRNSPDNQITSRKQLKHNYWLGPQYFSNIPTSNMFEGLEDDGDSDITPNEEVPKPPPIYVAKVSNINPLTHMLSEKVGNQYIIKTLNNGEVKIQPNNSEVYSIIVKELQAKNTEFRIYKPKKDRSFKVVLKYLHYSTDIENIKNEITSHGHDVMIVWNIKRRITKKPCSLFYVELKPNPDNKKIYEI